MRFDHPKAFAVVGTISVLGDKFDMPNRKHLVAKRRPTSINVPAEVAAKVHRALVRTGGYLGTGRVDCYAFAAAYAGVKGHEVDLTKEWEISREELFRGSVCGKVIYMAGDDIAKAESPADVRTPEHWFVPLDERGEHVINVACVAGPLMICSRELVEQMYPLEFKFVAEPLAT